MAYNRDIENMIRGMTPERLRQYKRELLLTSKSMAPEQLSAVYERIRFIPELSDIVGSFQVTKPTVKPTTDVWAEFGGYPSGYQAPIPQASLWQQNQMAPVIQQAQQLRQPLSPLGISQPIEQWGKFAASRLAYPWTRQAQQTTPRFAEPVPMPGGGAYLPRQDIPAVAYQQWQAPWGVKGAMELGAELPIWAMMPAPKIPIGAIAAKLGIKGAKKVAPVAKELALGEAGGIGKELGTVEAMWGKAKVPKNVPARYLKLTEQLNDIYYGLRTMQTRVEKKGIEIIPGAERDITTLLTRAPGVANAGATRYILTINQIKRIAPDVMVDDINTILYANFAKQVLTEKGAQRVMAGGFKTTAELDQVLAQLQTKLGTQYSKAEQAAKVVRGVYNEERNRQVEEGLISEELGKILAEKYSWYNPLHYVEYAEKEAARGKAVKPFTVISSGLRRLTEKGTAKEAQAPLEVLGDQLIRNEVRIHKNQTAKAIIKLALDDKLVGVKKITGIRPVAKVGEREIPAVTLGDLQVKLGRLRTQYEEALGPATEDTARSIRIEEQMDMLRKQIRQAEWKGTKPEDIVREVTIEPELIFRPTRGEIPGTLSFFEGGTRQIYEVPDWIYREANVLSQTISNPVSSLIGTLNGISRAAFTSFSPPFVVRNMLNDSLTALISRGILPTQTGMRLLGSLRGLENDSIMQSFRLAGGYQMRFYGRSAGELAKEVGVTGGKIAKNNFSFRKFILDAIPRAGEAGEQAPRMALFQRELNKNLPGWKTMTVEEIARTPQARKAAADAVELTINFGRGAYLVKAANPFVIFLNANMEAMKLPYRVLAKNPNARWRLAGIAAGGMGLTSYNLSYPEYFDVPNDIRWGSIMVMLPSKEKDERGNPKPNYICIIPRTREWSTFLGSLTYGMEKLYSDNPTDFGRFAATMAPLITPASTSWVPLPQVLEELYEQKANWDYYRSAPIVPTELQGLPKEQQVTPWTSKTLQAIANTVDISPIRLQHGISGLFGGAGAAITSVTDLIANLISPPKVDPRIVALTEQYKTIQTAIERNKFLMNLSSEDKEAIFTQLRQPEKGIPVVSPIVKGIVPERGGQLYRTGQELAEKQTGITAQETQKVYKVLSKLSDTYLSKQKALDKTFTAGDITGVQWREGRTELGTRYQGALDALGIQFPTAAQVQQDSTKATAYYNTINTLAGTIPDKRERSEVLAAGWYAIDLQEAVPGEKDWDTFFAMREGYKQSLSPEDRQLLEDYLTSRMTDVEKIYNRAQQVLRPYWDITDKVWEQYPPGLQQLSDLIVQLEDTDPISAKKALRQYPQILYARRLIAQLKKQARQRYPEIDGALNLFY